MKGGLTDGLFTVHIIVVVGLETLQFFDESDGTRIYRGSVPAHEGCGVDVGSVKREGTGGDDGRKEKSNKAEGGLHFDCDEAELGGQESEVIDRAFVFRRKDLMFLWSSNGAVFAIHIDTSNLRKMITDASSSCAQSLWLAAQYTETNSGRFRWSIHVGLRTKPHLC